MASESKTCGRCGKRFERACGRGKASWAKARFCSAACWARKPLRERLLRAIKVEESGCWEWQSWLNDGGYGRLHIQKEDGAGRYIVLAHRASYEEFVGHIPDGAILMHSCDNRKCINPDHLSVGDYSLNLREAYSRGRVGKLSTEKAEIIRAGGKSDSEFANQFGVTVQSIRAVRLGRSWQPLPQLEEGR